MGRVKIFLYPMLILVLLAMVIGAASLILDQLGFLEIDAIIAYFKLGNSNTEIEAEVERIEEKTNVREEQISEYKNQIESLQNKNNRLHEKLAEKEGHLEMLLAEIDELNRESDMQEGAVVYDFNLEEVFTGMRAREAGAILSSMEKGEAADILLHLDAKLSGSILESMEPDPAAEIVGLLNARDE